MLKYISVCSYGSSVTGNCYWYQRENSCIVTEEQENSVRKKDQNVAPEMASPLMAKDNVSFYNINTKACKIGNCPPSSIDGI